MRSFTSTLICLLIWQVVSAQGITISGQVMLKNTKQSISDINIFMDNGSQFTVSDGIGYFEIDDVKPGEYILYATGIGFKNYNQDIHVKNEDISLDITMEESIIDLPVVEVNAESGTGGLLGSLDLPGSGHYISRSEMKAINTTNPHDILGRIPGIQLQEEDGFGLRPNIGLRASGAERSSKITVMEDGVLSAPAPYAAPSAYYFPTIGRMQGVEVMKGASQITYGPYTTGGVINLISTTIPNEFRGKISMGAGSFGARNLHAMLGDKRGGISYMLETFQYQANGYKTIDFSDNETGFDKKDYLAKVKWQSSSDADIYQSLQLKVGESKEHSDETYLGLSYQDFLNNPYRRYAGSQMDEMNTQHNQYAIKYLINPVSKLFIQTVAYQNNFKRNWYKLDKVSDQTGNNVGIAQLLDNRSSFPEAYELVSGRTSIRKEALMVKANNRSYLAKGIQTKMNYIGNDFQFEAGIRYHYDEMDRYQWVDDYGMSNGVMELLSAGVQGTESNRIESAKALASYIQAEKVWDKWKVTAGLRQESIAIQREDFGKEDPERIGTDLKVRKNEVNVMIPGISLQYQVSETDELFAGVHRGFSPPGSSPNTDPELSVNYEIGYRMEQSQVFGSIVGFFNNYSNLLGSDLASSGGQGSGDLFDGGAVHAYGLEVAMSYKKPITRDLWMPIQFQYTYSKASFQNDFESDFDAWGQVNAGDELPYLANHVFNVSTGINAKKWSLNVSLNYMGEMKTEAGDENLPGEAIIDDRLLVSTNINFKLTRYFDITMGVHNLLNSAYAVASRPAGWRPGAPRNFRIGVEARF